MATKFGDHGVSSDERIGQRFGLLTVVSLIKARRKKTVAVCRCECGNEKISPLSNIVTGHVTNCGCKTSFLRGSGMRRHGKSYTPAHRRWSDIKKRTGNPSCKSFHRYGGRGILMHPNWRESFESFNIDVGEPPTPLHTLERIDNNGNYEPGNVRWATRKEQARNTRRNVLTMQIAEKVRELFGLGMKQAEIAKLFSISTGNVASVITMKTWVGKE